MNELMTVYSTESGEVALSAQTVRQYLVNGNGSVSDQEVTMFLNLCKYQKLNPFLREAYLIKFGTMPATIVVGKEVFTKRASKIKECRGWQAGITLVNSNGSIDRREGSLLLEDETLVGGWCKVYREGWDVPMLSEVGINEYMKMKDGKPQAQWAVMPAVMIRKVAIVTALRDTFPEDYQGLYDSSEMPVDATKLDSKPIVIPAQEELFADDEKPTTKTLTISEAQAKRMFKLAKNDIQLVKNILIKNSYVNSIDVLKTDYERICKEIEETANPVEPIPTEVIPENQEPLPWDIQQ